MRRPVTAYVLVVGCTCVVLCARLALSDELPGISPFVMFHSAAVFGGWFGGLWPGLLGTGASLVLVNFLFMAPARSLGFLQATDVTHTLVFAGQGVFLSVMFEYRLRSLERERERSDALRRLTSELTLSEERERRRVAHGLHDHLQQLLIASRMQLALIKRNADDDPVRTSADQADELLAEAIDFTRSLTADMSPPVLADLGLLAGLRWTAAEFERRFGLVVDVRGEEAAASPSEDVRVLLFHAVRELLFNVAKHAGTDRATVSLTCDGDVLRLAVEDDGVGYDAAAIATRSDGGGGFGLFSIRERLTALGGRMETRAAPGLGVRTTLVAPVRTLEPTRRVTART